MKLLSTASLMLFLLLSACNTTEEDDTTTSDAPVQAPVSNPTDTVSTKSNVIPPATQTTSTALNPAHGMPGHRCDIAVGAPLNSAPAAATTAPSAPAQPVIIQKTPATAPPAGGATVAKNPAHGMPGHRCDIAVGAPLN